jgi:hypothetical protein
LREQVNEAPDHEQDAEQDRNQQDRGRKSFHIPNVTPPTADWGMPILLAPGLSFTFFADPAEGDGPSALGPSA